MRWEQIPTQRASSSQPQDCCAKPARVVRTCCMWQGAVQAPSKLHFCSAEQPAADRSACRLSNTTTFWTLLRRRTWAYHARRHLRCLRSFACVEGSQRSLRVRRRNATTAHVMPAAQQRFAVCRCAMCHLGLSYSQEVCVLWIVSGDDQSDRAVGCRCAFAYTCACCSCFFVNVRRWHGVRMM